jgi:hypothetical protein
MCNKTKQVLTVQLLLVTDVQDFIELSASLCGKARLIQGETNVSINSRLGVMSLAYSKEPFNIVFTECSDNEIDRFKRFEYKEPLDKFSEDSNNIDVIFKLEG